MTHAGARTVVVLPHTDSLLVALGAPDPRPVNSFAIAASFVTALVEAAALTATGASRHTTTSFIIVAIVVALTSYTWCRHSAALINGIFGWLIFHGFVLDSSGILHWHGVQDAAHLGALMSLALGASLVRTSASKYSMPRFPIVDNDNVGHSRRQGDDHA
jgi:hypothetical protein